MAIWKSLWKFSSRSVSSKIVLRVLKKKKNAYEVLTVWNMLQAHLRCSQTVKGKLKLPCLYTVHTLD